MSGSYYERVPQDFDPRTRERHTHRLGFNMPYPRRRDGLTTVMCDSGYISPWELQPGIQGGRQDNSLDPHRSP